MPLKNTQSIRRSRDNYAEFLFRLDPVAVTLKGSTSHLERLAYAQLFRSRRAPLIEVVASYKLEEVGRDYFNAAAEFKVEVRKGKARRAPLVLDAAFETHIHGEAPIKREFAERFVNGEFASLVWPYFRQLVLDTCAKMAIPRIPISLLPNPR